MIDVDHSEMIKKFGLEMGIDLNLDDEGCCQLIVDENRIINVRSCQDDGLVILSAPVAVDLPDPISYPLVLDLLDYSMGPCFLKGGNCPVVGCDPETNQVIMYHVVTASVLSEKNFIDIFTQFLSEIDAFAEMISKNSAETENILSESVKNNFNNFVEG